MEIIYRKTAAFCMWAALMLTLAGCGATVCGYSLTGKDEMIFACSDGRDDPEESPVQEKAPEDSPDDRESSADSPDAGLVDLKSAGTEELMTLHGIGESRAAAIIEFREKNGPFVAIEEIMMIPGIKEGIFSKIKDQIIVR